MGLQLNHGEGYCPQVCKQQRRGGTLGWESYILQPCYWEAHTDIHRRHWSRRWGTWRRSWRRQSRRQCQYGGWASRCRHSLTQCLFVHYGPTTIEHLEGFSFDHILRELNDNSPEVTALLQQMGSCKRLREGGLPHRDQWWRICYSTEGLKWWPMWWTLVW